MFSRHFGAYDRTLWIVQSQLKAIGIDPGAVDGLWGPATLGAALQFRDMISLPSMGTDQASVIDAGFLAELAQQAAQVGWGETPPSSLPGGSGVGPVPVTPGGGSIPGTPPPDSSSMILPGLLLAAGLLLFLGAKK
jgi:hypothetical protein